MKGRTCVVFVLTLCSSIYFALAASYASDEYAQELTGNYWEIEGRRRLEKALHLKRYEGVAKNVIFFLGDGMGIPTVTAMRIYKGQQNNKRGEDEELSFDKFPHVSLSKTYSIDKMVSDSACTATAYFCGVKANYETLGVDGRVGHQDCDASLKQEYHAQSLLHKAQKAGKRTGVLTTTRVTHATPAALYAHSAFRDWEGTCPHHQCEDIAAQLVHQKPGRDINVIMGGGRSAFLPSSANVVNRKLWQRNDTRNLLSEWQEMKGPNNPRAKLVLDDASFKEVDPTEVDYLLGLFHPTHLPFVADQDKKSSNIPSLAEMTKKAIQILSQGDRGYFLAVEGGRIDSAHHESWAHKALVEGYEFDKAVETALDMTNREDTLVVVTADHSHTMSIGGDYPARGSNILGLGGINDIDNRTMTILTYANGLGYNNTKRNLTQSEVLDKDFRQDSTYPRTEETHGGEDVGVYAIGPMAHLFHGVHDQTYIPYVIEYATCMGYDGDRCGELNSVVYMDSAGDIVNPNLTIIALIAGLIIICLF